MTENKSAPGEGDELVPLARIVEELSWPTHRVRLAMEEAESRLRVVVSGRTKRYPLAYTVAMLRERRAEEEPSPDLKNEERVSLENLAAELGWTPTTVRRYMTTAKPVVRFFADSKDGRKKTYPRHHTLRLLRREHARVQARRERSRNDAAGYWTALSTLKVSASRLRQLSAAATAIEREVRLAYEALRLRPPSSLVEIYSLPDTKLDLLHPVCALVAPLRLIYWKATIPEIPLRGEGKTAEDAVLELREKLASNFRQLQHDPESNPPLWVLLQTLIRERRYRTPSAD